MYKRALMQLTDGELIRRWEFEHQKTKPLRDLVLMREIVDMLLKRQRHMSDYNYSRMLKILAKAREV